MAWPGRIVGESRQRAMLSQARFDEMKSFFGGVGEGHAAGIWEDIPRERPEFIKKQRAKRGLKAATRMGSC